MITQPSNGIVAQGVSKRFGVKGSELTILKDIEMTAGLGEVVSVLGRSGSGKTTLLSLLGALERPSHGEITILGTEMSKASDSSMEYLLSLIHI